MDVEELSMIGPVVDLKSVDAIHHKRIVAFVNHFIINTTHFLNRLSCTVESKLFQVDDRIQKLEASIILLESKLSSIPGLDVEIPAITETVPQSTEKLEIPNIPEATTEQTEVDNKEPEEPVQALDENLIKYVKMLQFGVPIPAVKLKMTQEGISPDKQQLVISHCNTKIPFNE